MENLWIALLSSSVLAGIVSGVVSIITKALDHKWNKSDKLAEIEKKVNRNEVDSVRLQMLVMMSDYPHETTEILRLAEHYFKDLKGNWYMTTMFNKWLKDNEIAEPEWFANRKV